MRNYSQMPTVEFRNFQLRTLLKKDYHDLFSFGQDEVTTEFLTWGPLKNLKEAKNMIKYTYYRRLSRKEPIGYAIVDMTSNKMVGTIEFHSFNHKQNSCEIGYVLSRNYWNQGIMTDALKEMTKIGFEVLDMDMIIIKHIKENIASQRVIHKAGYDRKELLKNSFFHPKTQRFHDVYVYEKTRRTYDK